MTNSASDTIAAISSATGGAVAVIRLSGKKAFDICLSAWTPAGSRRNSAPVHGAMTLGKCRFAGRHAPETAYAVFFKSPRSYTGEDIAEIHCHGGGIVADRILHTLLSKGARQADPGEFTLRSFLNGKMDLSQAEAVADIIAAKSELALDIAERQLEGAIGNEIRGLSESLSSLLAECETELDFAEEHGLKSRHHLGSMARKILSRIEEILATAKNGMIIRDGFRIVIAGHPNAGKSSIFNRLLGKERAIVTEIPGTTRDTIEEDVLMGSLRVTLIDTAGLREADDIIEKLGIQRSRKSIESADMVLWVLDPFASREAQLAEMRSHSPGGHTIAMWNKSDLIPRKTIASMKRSTPEFHFVSAKDGRGLDELKRTIVSRTGIGTPGARTEYAVNSRHQRLLSQAAADIAQALPDLRISQLETAALFIRKAMGSLRQITGEDFDPDILDSIFSRFCIGK